MQTCLSPGGKLESQSRANLPTTGSLVPLTAVVVDGDLSQRRALVTRESCAARALGRLMAHCGGEGVMVALAEPTGGTHSLQVPNPRRRKVGGVRSNQPEKLERAMSSGSRAVSLLKVRGNWGGELRERREGQMWGTGAGMTVPG